MIRFVAMIALLNWPFALERWLGADKLKHFLMSALVQSATFSIARGAGVDRSGSQIAGGVAVLSAGIGKEIYDRRSRKNFSIEDLTWDLVGGAAAGALLNGTR